MNKLFLTIFLTSLILGGFAATNTYYDYKLNGKDWATNPNFPECSKSNQSPIDLRTTMHAEPFPLLDGAKDLTVNYTSFKNVQVKWMGKTTQVTLPTPAAGKGHPDYKMMSEYAIDKLGAAGEFNAVQFHFHSQSEHTIDNKRFDLEMHTVHYPKTKKGDIIGSALGVIFDTKNYDKKVSNATILAIDNFFESLKFNLKTNPTVAEIPYNKLKEVLNLKDRWVYKGSLTTPPCSRYIYFQVLYTVYPIKAEHLKLFKTIQMARSTQTNPTLVKSGNWREIQKIDKHDVHLFHPSAIVKSSVDNTTILAVVLSVLAVLIIAAVAVVIIKKKQNAKKEEGGNIQQGQNPEVQQMQQLDIKGTV